MKHLKATSLLFALILSVNFINAQDTDTGNWFIYFGNQAINKKWNWHNEVQYRNYNFAGDTQQLLLRTGIGYNLTENNNNVLLGYGFINSQNYIPGTDNKADSNEHRIFQQFITRQNFGRVYLQHRYRVEERFLKDDFQMRFRYFLAINVPLNKPKMEDNAFYFSAYNEIFINAESPAFDRDRIYGALGYVINKNFRVEAGFMRQIQENTGRNQFQIVVYNNIPFNSSK
ncbi:DUF2490 domain-containing protein [Flavobacterium sp. DGU38]|uniref:DUF2490 domain-containing protein n=1 Tax=Flavobacterium calami TaxID=3139144 RepID=A0ABU9ITS8_9FLAO